MTLTPEEKIIATTPREYRLIVTALKDAERRYLPFQMPSELFHGERLIVGRHEVVVTMAPAELMMLLSWAERSDKMNVELRVGWVERVLKGINGAV